MMRRARLRPSPQPRRFVEKPGRKTWRAVARSIPLPVSRTKTSTSPPISVPVIAISCGPGIPSIASRAFLSRFSMTHSYRSTLSRAVSQSGTSTVMATGGPLVGTRRRM